MPYLHIKDFKYGMDRRRPREVGVPGTLWTLQNAVITRGGDIQRAKKFVSAYTLPAGTVGLFSLNQQLYVFGSGSTPVGMPPQVQYVQLAAPNTPTLTRIHDAEAFDGKIVVVAEYDDGSIYRFYDGARVTDLDTTAASQSSHAAVAVALARKADNNAAAHARAYGDTVLLTATTPGTAFTIAGAAVDGGGTPTAAASTLTSNVAAVAETRATGTVTITGGTASSGINQVSQITVDGVNLLGTAVDFITDNSATANAVAVEINNGTSTHNYTASSAGAAITLQAATGTGAGPNGDVVAVTVAGDVTATKADVSGGVAEVAAVAQVSKVVIGGASFNAADAWTVTVDGTSYKTTGLAAGMGTSLYVTKNRVWSTAGSLVEYCALNDPTDHSTTTPTATAYGIINIGQQSSGASTLIGIGDYNGQSAIFGEEDTAIYTFDTDPANIVAGTPIRNTGALAHRSIVNYGNQDLFYLDEKGVRSLKSRDGYNAAYVDDIGNAIDPWVQAEIANISACLCSRSKAIIEPQDGRYMLALGQKILVLSRFPASSITAWSFLDLGFDIDNLVHSGQDVFVRSGNTIYQYGGAGRDTYPDANEYPVVVETPFMGAGDEARKKALDGWDQTALNTWNVQVATDPNHPDRYIDVGYIDGNTYHKEANAPLPGYTSSVALRMECSAAGDARMSSVAFHYDGGEVN